MSSKDDFFTLQEVNEPVQKQIVQRNGFIVNPVKETNNYKPY